MLRQLAARARHHGLPPPAAFVGDWYSSVAVLAPSVSLRPVVAVPPPLSPVDGPAGAVGGGWVGYLGYGLTDPVPRPRLLPGAVAGWADHVLRRDAAGRWWYEELGDGDPARRDELAALVASGADPPPAPWRASGLRCPDPERYRAAVRAAVEEIAAGEVYQVNICTRYEARFAGDPAELYATGVARWRPARSALLAGPWGAVVSFSPELFLARHDTIVTSSPIKGTRPRRGPGDDSGAAALRASAKDVAENVMIVDMTRNDLGRVCTTGSVAVPRLLEVQPHPGVWHLVSTVTGRLAAGVGDAELLRAAFPPASVTGTPKHRALRVIGVLEDQAREVYCGAVGLASPVAGLECSVAIRTCEIAGDRLWLGIGGGITADSDPDAEWAECETKAAPILALLHPS